MSLLNSVAGADSIDSSPHACRASKTEPTDVERAKNIENSRSLARNTASGSRRTTTSIFNSGINYNFDSVGQSRDLLTYCISLNSEYCRASEYTTKSDVAYFITKSAKRVSGGQN